MKKLKKLPFIMLQERISLVDQLVDLVKERDDQLKDHFPAYFKEMKNIIDSYAFKNPEQHVLFYILRYKLNHKWGAIDVLEKLHEIGLHHFFKWHHDECLYSPSQDKSQQYLSTKIKAAPTHLQLLPPPIAGVAARSFEKESKTQFKKTF